MCVWEQSSEALCHEACGASEPWLSYTSISVHVPPSLKWNHHEDDTELEPLRERTSKKPPAVRAVLCSAAVVKLS